MKTLLLILSLCFFYSCNDSNAVKSSKTVFVYVDKNATIEDPSVPGVFIPAPDSVFMNIVVSENGDIVTKLSNE